MLKKDNNNRQLQCNEIQTIGEPATPDGGTTTLISDTKIKNVSKRALGARGKESNLQGQYKQ